MTILIDVRKNSVLNVYRRIFFAGISYWAIMAGLHVACLFKINLYIYLNTANKFTVGAITILILLFYLFSTIFRNDKQK